MKKLLLGILLLPIWAYAQKITQTELGLRSVKTLKKNGLLFKDLNKNGKLDAYEDWRLSSEQRALDLVRQMTLEEKVGFMLISTSRMAGDNGNFAGGASADLSSGFNETDMVLDMNMFTRKPLPFPLIMAAGTTKAIEQFHLRHFIFRANTSAEMIAQWANNLQEVCEKQRLGIPAIIASNPRNHLTQDAAVGLSVGSTVFSKWPGELGLAAMNDLSLTRSFAEIAAKEWAAVGLRKGYMYMADLATESRWQRIEGTFGEDADLSANMMREIVLGFQGPKLNKNSIALTTKHFPGGGPQVKGHDPHFVWGQDQHYPGGMFEYHLKPFKAAIEAGTSAIMPYYAKPIDPQMEPIAFAYNKAILQDLLRDKLGFQGIINSDTGPIEMMPWGVENLSINERYAKAIACGVDLFSGSADPQPLLETVKSGLVTEARINESIIRLLKEKFELGLFENPYVDPKAASETVGNKSFQEKADLAQRKSIVLLRNESNLLPLKKGLKICFISYYDKGNKEPAIQVLKPNNSDYEFVDNREEADVVVLWLTPTSGSLFSSSDAELEIQLSKNKIDVAFVNETTYHKPTVVAINFTRPWVLDEIDNPHMNGLLATFGCSQEALFDVISGQFSPNGKMPFSIPKSKKAVLENLSDVPGYLEKKQNYLFRFGDGLKY